MSVVEAGELMSYGTRGKKRGQEPRIHRIGAPAGDSMRIIYAEEKLTNAVEILAAGSGRVKERLRNAAASLVCLRPDDFPDGHLRRTFVGVIDDLTYQHGGENEDTYLPR